MTLAHPVMYHVLCQQKKLGYHHSQRTRDGSIYDNEEVSQMERKIMIRSLPEAITMVKEMNILSERSLVIVPKLRISFLMPVPMIHAVIVFL